MMKCQIGLGVLSIPAAFDVLGMIPGVICMMVIAALSTWGSYVIGGFKLNHREIYGIDNAAGIMFGRVGREIVGFCFILCKCKQDIRQWLLLTHDYETVSPATRRRPFRVVGRQVTNAVVNSAM